MGWFGRKRGGTKVGNFIRQWLWNNSEVTAGVHLAGEDIKTLQQNGTINDVINPTY